MPVPLLGDRTDKVANFKLNGSRLNEMGDCFGNSIGVNTFEIQIQVQWVLLKAFNFMVGGN